jgi:hypothetical protein
MNGGDWYRECSQWLRTSSDQKKQRTPEKVVAQRACQIEVIRIYCNANYEGDARKVSESETTETKEQWMNHLKKFCPSHDHWNMPFGGPPVLVIREVEKEGGPGIIETYAPASWLIERVFKRLFEGCSREREKLGLFQTPRECVEAWVKNIDAD